jgi:hypothetical protein
LGPVKIELVDEDVYGDSGQEVEPTKLESVQGGVWPFKTSNKEDND